MSASALDSDLEPIVPAVTSPEAPSAPIAAPPKTLRFFDEERWSLRLFNRERVLSWEVGTERNAQMLDKEISAGFGKCKEKMTTLECGEIGLFREKSMIFFRGVTLYNFRVLARILSVMFKCPSDEQKMSDLFERLLRPPSTSPMPKPFSQARKVFQPKTLVIPAPPRSERPSLLQSPSVASLAYPVRADACTSALSSMRSPPPLNKIIEQMFDPRTFEKLWSLRKEDGSAWSFKDKEDVLYFKPDNAELASSAVKSLIRSTKHSGTRELWPQDISISLNQNRFCFRGVHLGNVERLVNFILLRVSLSERKGATTKPLTTFLQSLLLPQSTPVVKRIIHDDDSEGMGEGVGADPHGESPGKKLKPDTALAFQGVKQEIKQEVLDSSLESAFV